MLLLLTHLCVVVDIVAVVGVAVVSLQNKGAGKIIVHLVSDDVVDSVVTVFFGVFFLLAKEALNVALIVFCSFVDIVSMVVAVVDLCFVVFYLFMKHSICCCCFPSEQRNR